MHYHADRCITRCHGNACTVNYAGLRSVPILIVWSGLNLLTKRIKYLMAEWSGEYISPYAEHGKKSEQVKKITVSIPLKVLKILTDERTRRQVNNLRHATNSELLCEAFLHAFTGQPCRMMPTCVKSAATKFRRRQKRSCVRWGLTGDVGILKRKRAARS